MNSESTDVIQEYLHYNPSTDMDTRMCQKQLFGISAFTNNNNVNNVCFRNNFFCINYLFRFYQMEQIQ